MGIRFAMGQFSELRDELLQFAKQLGCAGVQLNTPKIPGDTHWSVDDLARLRDRCEAYGLRLEALENTPRSFYDKAMLGLPGRDEQIESFRLTIRNMGRAGVPILGYHWMANGVWRTSRDSPGRGGATCTAFDLDELRDGALLYGFGDAEVTAAHMDRVEASRPTHGRAYTDEEMWENYAYFIRAVLPAAEEAGVVLALHPDDPPVPALGGIARIMRDFTGIERALEIGASPSHKLEFCVGTWSEMGPGVADRMRHFGARGRIAYVHFRDVQGSVPAFRECFLGEGNVDPVEIVRTLLEIDFDGFVLDDHTPGIIGDTAWGHRGRAFSTGYVMGLVEALSWPFH